MVSRGSTACKNVKCSLGLSNEEKHKVCGKWKTMRLELDTYTRIVAVNVNEYER